MTGEPPADEALNGVESDGRFTDPINGDVPASIKQHNEYRNPIHCHIMNSYMFNIFP